MNIKEYTFPEVTKLGIAFPTFDTIPELLAEARKRGFYNGDTKWNDKFNELFYFGGKDTDEMIDHPNTEAALKYCVALMRSFAPKHEEKEAVCALILSEFLVDKDT